MRASLGSQYSERWLAQALDSSLETARELDGYWMPDAPMHLVEHSIAVFANALHLDFQRLAALLRKPAPKVSADLPTRQPASPEKEAVGACADQRPARAPQPLIVYRKARRAMRPERIADPAAEAGRG